jgi:DNA-binding NtrC family response regulator
MLNILLVGKDPVSLTDFSAELSRKEGVRVNRAISAKEAWGVLGNYRVDVVVTDTELGDGSALPFIHELTKQQPLINCAMVSSLAPKDFHEATEGLGVFMQLPVDPGAEDAVKMVHFLESIDALLSM